MSEMYPPDGGQEPSAPPAPPAPPQMPPRIPPQPEPPHAYAGATPPGYGRPATPHKRTLHVGFAILGFFAPWIASAVISAVSYFVSSAASDAVVSFFGPLMGLLGIATFVGILLAFLMGRARGDDRLRSFGLGGLISYGVIVLVGLLAFGACMVALNNGAPFSG